MNLSDFNKKVEEIKKEFLNQDAHDMFCRLNTQHIHRIGGIKYNSFDDILTEIAQAKILDVDFVDDINIGEAIKNL